jgi:hypothetical protein
MNENILKLTDIVYRLLEFFPEAEPLKSKIKDKVLAIVQSPKNEDIDSLLGYLLIAKNRGWLNLMNYLIVSNEYEKLRKEEKLEFKPEFKQEYRPESKPVKEEAKISNRQEKIMEFLTKNGKAQVMDLQTVLSNVTKRTIRRDLDELLKFGKIVRLGEFNQVFYEIGQ